MTKVAIAEEVAERIRNSEGPIELVDAQGQTIGAVRQRRKRLNEHEAERAKTGNAFRGLKWRR